MPAMGSARQSTRTPAASRTMAPVTARTCQPGAIKVTWDDAPATLGMPDDPGVLPCVTDPAPTVAGLVLAAAAAMALARDSETTEVARAAPSVASSRPVSLRSRRRVARTAARLARLATVSASAYGT